ncbi:MAG: outer membrane beta-barrel protein, partial [Cyanobacteria bacterium P01_H01_bin.58]
QEVAQVTRPLYRGAAPFYVGVGGNIGIIDSDESSVGDFGFNIISKVSFGPRFSIRPTIGISEDDVNFTIPLTYNFNPIEVGEFNMFPFAGAGADISDEVGLLINGGVDIPISRDFTLNGQLNWRTTNDTGLGLSLGVGYNFPFFFE